MLKLMKTSMTWQVGLAGGLVGLVVPLTVTGAYYFAWRSKENDSLWELVGSLNERGVLLISCICWVAFGVILALGCNRLLDAVLCHWNQATGRPEQRGFLILLVGVTMLVVAGRFTPWPALCDIVRTEEARKQNELLLVRTNDLHIERYEQPRQ
jgi:hypothetical protein